MPRGRGKRKGRIAGALRVVRDARVAAKKALDSLRSEIKSTRQRLDDLLAEERSFRVDLFAGQGSAGPRPPRRKGPPRAERFFKKLPDTFTLEDVRKIAGRASGVSLAQWSRSKRIRKVGDGYRKLKKK